MNLRLRTVRDICIWAVCLVVLAGSCVFVWRAARNGSGTGIGVGRAAAVAVVAGAGEKNENGGGIEVKRTVRVRVRHWRRAAMCAGVSVAAVAAMGAKASCAAQPGSGFYHGSASASPSAAAPAPGSGSGSGSGGGSGGFPNAGNTGAEGSCSGLASSGSVTVGAGGVVEGKNISGGITVTGGGVRIVDDCVSGGDLYPIHFVGSGGGVINHVTVMGEGGSGGCSRAVEPAGSGPVVMNHMNVSGCEDGVEMYDGDTVENSYIHDLAFFSGSHNDGVQQNGGSGDVVKHNTILNPHNQTSCVNFTTDFGPISDITIEDNYLDGGNYTVYVRAGSSGGSVPQGVSVTGNTFGDGDVYGLLSADGNVAWSGNVNTAGAAVGSG